MTNDDLHSFARQVIITEAAAAGAMVKALDDAFVRAVELILGCKGSVLTCGMGKAGHIARKVSTTLASTGTPSHFLSVADAVHGDIGSVRSGDVVIIFSASGESDEVLRMLSIVKKMGHPVIGITKSKTSGLGKHSDIVLQMGPLEEACPLGLAPSASTTAMLVLGDALALTVMKQRSFTAEDFAMFHPAGQLGRKLIHVREAMTFKKGENLAVASDALTVGEVLHQVSSIKRRSGAVVLVNDSGMLTGIFTDGDLRRMITNNVADVLKKPISEVMGRNPKRIHGDALASEAMSVMKQFRIDELPVIDDNQQPIGMIDVQDLVVLRMLDVEAEK